MVDRANWAFGFPRVADLPPKFDDIQMSRAILGWIKKPLHPEMGSFDVQFIWPNPCPSRHTINMRINRECRNA